MALWACSVQRAASVSYTHLDVYKRQRLNCAEALIYGLGLSKTLLFDIYNGRDRYAREILNYVLEKEEIRRKDREEGQWHV